MRRFTRLGFIVVLVAFTVTASAQFSTSGGNTTTMDKVGIGTAAPVSELHVVTQQVAPPLRGLTVDQYAPDQQAVLFTGRRARGTLNAPLAAQSGDHILNLFPMAYDGTTFINSARVRFSIDGPVSTNFVPMALQIWTGTNGGSERLRVTSGGDVGIGTGAPAAKLHVVGNVQIDGTLSGTNIKAHYQDVAEWVPSRHDLAPGTVVVLDANVGNGVIASKSAYDTSVAGVVSEKPGIILGEEGTDKEQIATTGRVRVKVDATTASIKVGDLLVTSDKPGYAMKSMPMDINGRKFHQPGTIVGKALESLAGGEGEILVLLSLQ